VLRQTATIYPQFETIDSPAMCAEARLIAELCILGVSQDRSGHAGARVFARGITLYRFARKAGAPESVPMRSSAQAQAIHALISISIRRGSKSASSFPYSPTGRASRLRRLFPQNW